MSETLAPRAEPSGDEPLIRAFVGDRFVDMFLSQNRRAQLGLLVAAVLVTFIWVQSSGSVTALAWMVLALAVTVMRFVYTERFVRSVDATRRTGRIIIVLAINGVLMAIPLLAFEEFPALERAAISIILLALATGSVATTLGFRSVYAAFAVPMLLPLVVAWGLVAWHTGTAAALGLALLIAFYLLFLQSVGRQAYSVFEDSCRFRYGEQQLNRELSQALAQASEANRAKTHFLASASHDLRQPIHTMTLVVETLSRRELDPASREMVTLLGAVIEMLAKQLDTLLDISKLDAGVMPVDLQSCPLLAVVRSHHASTEPAARQRGFELLLDLPDDSAQTLRVVTDATLLTRTLSNLTDNALKFSRPGGTVRISVTVQGDEALIVVADQGIGIDPAEQERVFLEFYQVGNTARERLRGLGLGLSIVRRLCLLLGIQLQLQSEPGRGTTVTLRMPLAAPTELPVTIETLRGHVRPGLRVLVIDDEAMVCQSMGYLLRQLGCVAYVAEDLASARQQAGLHGIDVVLSDLRLRAGESGLDAIRAVRALHHDAHAVLITADTAPDRMREAQAVGLPLLYKPVKPDELIAQLPQS